MASTSYPPASKASVSSVRYCCRFSRIYEFYQNESTSQTALELHLLPFRFFREKATMKVRLKMSPMKYPAGNKT